MQAWMICHKDKLSIDFGQRKWTMLYGSKLGSLIYNMVYKPLGKFEPSMFWRQGFRSMDWKPLKMLQWVKEEFIWAFGKGYSTQVVLIMNIKNDLRSLHFHIVGVALSLAWEGKILGLESKDKLQPVSQWSFILSSWYIILCCDKHTPRYINLDKAGLVKELMDQGHVQLIKMIRVGWRMVDYQRAVNTFLEKIESGF